MIIEIVLLVVLGGGIVVLKIFHSESERKRRMEREQRKIRDLAATGGFAPKNGNRRPRRNRQKNANEAPRVNYSTVSGAFSSSLPLESLSSIAALMVEESF